MEDSEEEQVGSVHGSWQDAGTGTEHPFQDHHMRVQTWYRGACSEHQYPELLHTEPKR